MQDLLNNPVFGIILSDIAVITTIPIWGSTISTTVTMIPSPADSSLPMIPLTLEQTATIYYKPLIKESLDELFENIRTYSTQRRGMIPIS